MCSYRGRGRGRGLGWLCEDVRAYICMHIISTIRGVVGGNVSAMITGSEWKEEHVYLIVVVVLVPSTADRRSLWQRRMTSKGVGGSVFWYNTSRSQRRTSSQHLVTSLNKLKHPPSKRRSRSLQRSLTSAFSVAHFIRVLTFPITLI